MYFPLFSMYWVDYSSVRRFTPLPRRQAPESAGSSFRLDGADAIPILRLEMVATIKQFERVPGMYKVQLARRLTEQERRDVGNPCESLLEVLVPEIERRGWSCTVFVSAGLIGSDNAWDPDGRGKRALLDWAQIDEVSRRGIEIGGRRIN